MSKGLKTTVQESSGKYTAPIPTDLVNLLDLNKGDKFMWKMEDKKITI
ncbi:hypothetical protein [Methanolobus profundi]|uniref:Looped-hinge helix DNA binding domain-containing protein, AbrB family n=1 Tax=Methanolobus profundi TaxID=487685 RepID=A0A1I4SSZ4_9EURY|nr:hypothetical protein [Methanolobus profundi]SFM67562.1 hypothetical protein SAMN04488696_1998 [Methanolobus profundi]